MVDHLRKLGFDGDMTEYIKSLNGERYNCLTSTMMQIANYSHSLCEEYHSKKTLPERKQEIFNILIPIQGENLEVGDNLFIDYIGSVNVADNVKIGNGAVLAGNIKIGNNVKIGNDCIIQTVGHDVYHAGRHVFVNTDRTFVEYCTTDFITINNDVKIGNNCKVAPGSVVENNLADNAMILKN